MTKNLVYKTVKCDSCDVVVINNHICHEFGCPDKFKDEIRECKNCGCEFSPDNNNQNFCSDQCYYDYNGIPYEDREDN
jgi:hypothetical protein